MIVYLSKNDAPDIIVPFSAQETIVAEPSAPEFIDAYVSKSGTVGVEVPQSVCEHASQHDPAAVNMSEDLYMSAHSVNNGPPHTASTADTDAQVLEKSQTRVPEPVVECVMTASNYVPPAVILSEPIKMPEAACEMDYENVSEVAVATMENTTAEDLQMPSPAAIRNMSAKCLNIDIPASENMEQVSSFVQLLESDAIRRKIRTLINPQSSVSWDIQHPREILINSSGGGFNRIINEHWRSRWKEKIMP